MSFIFNSNVRQALEDLKQKKETALEVIGGKAESYAKQLCPVDTGRLRNSITHAQLTEDTEVIGTNVSYSIFVELGTRRSRAQPFLRPAAENHGSEYKAIVDRILRS